jgi:hypothetical protein
MHRNGYLSQFYSTTAATAWTNGWFSKDDLEVTSSVPTVTTNQISNVYRKKPISMMNSLKDYADPHQI